MAEAEIRGWVGDDGQGSTISTLKALHRPSPTAWSVARGIGVPVLKTTASARAFQRCAARAYVVTAHVVMALRSYGMGRGGRSRRSSSTRSACSRSCTRCTRRCTPCSSSGRTSATTYPPPNFRHRRPAWSIARGTGAPVLKMTASARAFQRYVARAYMHHGLCSYTLSTYIIYIGRNYIVMAAGDDGVRVRERSGPI